MMRMMRRMVPIDMAVPQDRVWESNAVVCDEFPCVLFRNETLLKLSSVAAARKKATDGMLSDAIFAGAQFTGYFQRSAPSRAVSPLRTACRDDRVAKQVSSGLRYR